MKREFPTDLPSSAPLAPRPMLAPLRQIPVGVDRYPPRYVEPKWSIARPTNTAAQECRDLPSRTSNASRYLRQRDTNPCNYVYVPGRTAMRRLSPLRPRTRLGLLS